MGFSFCRFVAGLATFGLAALAQTGELSSSSTTTGANVVHGTMNLAGRQFAGRPVTGAPYSAQRVSEHVQIASDGTRFTTTNRQETVYRDSQGRVRTERPLMMGPNAPADMPVLVEIQDPVSNVSYTLDTQNKVAHRVALDARPTRQTDRPLGGVAGPVASAQRESTGLFSASAIAPAPDANRNAHSDIKQEDLGQQQIEGVMAEGHRTTQTWPAGAQGSDRPFQVVGESWFSPEIKETVLSKSVDPRTGESTNKLINISRSEPSADLFVPPADYSIVDETGQFQIHWTATRQ
jgi:hypothetical protein